MFHYVALMGGPVAGFFDGGIGKPDNHNDRVGIAGAHLHLAGYASMPLTAAEQTLANRDGVLTETGQKRNRELGLATRPGRIQSRAN